MKLEDSFTEIIARDLFNFIIGHSLGVGVHRNVYEFLPDPNYVIKVETLSGSFQNILEWHTWERFQFDDRVAPWLAPCKSISCCGLYLLQERTERPKDYPDRIPAWIADRKRSNFGVLKNGNFVAHDYGGNDLPNFGPYNRMVKPNWWEDT